MTTYKISNPRFEVPCSCGGNDADCPKCHGTDWHWADPIVHVVEAPEMTYEEACALCDKVYERAQAAQVAVPTKITFTMKLDTPTYRKLLRVFGFGLYGVWDRWLRRVFGRN